jgi:hypothetical protein
MVSEIFNTHFIDIAEKLTDHKDIVYSRYQGSSWKLNSCPNKLFLNPVSEVEMKQIINKLKGKLTSGIDRVSEMVVRRSAEYIFKPLTNICNASFEAGILTDKLKMVVVKPLYKKGNSENIENYRPISLLSVFSKIIERVMNVRLTNFITNNDILVEAQNGFRKGKSTETAIQAFLETIYETLEKKKNKYSWYFSRFIKSL